MKDYCECAVVKVGYDKVGCFICNTEGKGLKNFDLLPWQYKDWNDFRGMVEEGKVQFLECKEDDVVCSYSKEEISYLKKEKKVDNSKVKDMERDYWNMSTTFSAKHIDLAYMGKCIAASANEVMNVQGSRMCTIYFVGIEDMLQDFLENDLSGLEKHVKKEEGVIRLVLPLKKISLLNEFKTKVLYDVSVLEWVYARVLTSGNKRKLLSKISDEKYKMEVIDRCNRLTEENLESMEEV